MKNKLVSAVAALALFASTARADSPFRATATVTDTSGLASVTATGSNFFDFIESINKSQGAFSSLSTHPYNADLTFLGVPNAIRFTYSSTSTSATAKMDLITGVSRTFTGTSKTDVDNQMSDFFKSNGAQIVADFLKEIAKRSAIAVTDGNPTSSTAMVANGTFSTLGVTAPDELAANITTTAEESKPRYSGFGLGFNAGTFEAAGFKGNFYDFSLTGLNIGFGERVRLLTPVGFNYLRLDAGSQVAGLGINVALPIRFKIMTKENPWNWRITPVLGASVRGSIDLASLSPLWQVGLVNTIDYRVNSKLILCLVSQITMHKSFSVKFDEMDFNPDIDQQIAKNGVRAVTRMTKRLIGEAFVVDTRFLKDAAIDQFWTFGAAISFRATRTMNLVIGANYDTGDDYKAYSIGMSSAWRW